MANRIFHDVQALNPGIKIVAGRFKPNGSSAIDNTANLGNGFTVARTTTGTYTITLDDVYPGYISAQCSLQHNGAGDKKLHFGAIDVSSAKTIVIYNIEGTSAADLAAHANNHVHFVLFLRNTSLTQ